MLGNPSGKSVAGLYSKSPGKRGVGQGLICSPLGERGGRHLAVLVNLYCSRIIHVDSCNSKLKTCHICSIF